MALTFENSGGFDWYADDGFLFGLRSIIDLMASLSSAHPIAAEIERQRIIEAALESDSNVTVLAERLRALGATIEATAAQSLIVKRTRNGTVALEITADALLSLGRTASLSASVSSVISLVTYFFVGYFELEGSMSSSSTVVVDMQRLKSIEATLEADMTAESLLIRLNDMQAALGGDVALDIVTQRRARNIQADVDLTADITGSLNQLASLQAAITSAINLLAAWPDDGTAIVQNPTIKIVTKGHTVVTLSKNRSI